MDNLKKEVKNPNIIIKKEITDPFKNFVILILLGIAFIIIFILLIYFLYLNLVKSILLAFLLVILYSIILFFLTDSERIKEIIKENTPKSIIQIKKEPYQVVHEVEKRIYFSNPQNKSNEPKGYKKSFISEPKLINQAKYVSSVKSGVFHKHSCRLSRLIKKKYKIYKQEPSYFIKHNYRPCDVCINKIKKV